MQVHVIRDEFCPSLLYDSVLETLNKSNGIIQFSESEHTFPNSNDSDDVPLFTFQELYAVCEAYRQKHHITPETHVFLLTGAKNYHNWFSNMDYNTKNYFVQATDWDLFFGTESEHSFIICYQIMAWLLKWNMFSTNEEIMSRVHSKPIGCMMDFCQDKRDITLKIRTADLCPTCLDIIKSRDIPFNLLNQIFALWEEIRKKIIFRERADLLNFVGRISIDHHTKSLTFSDYGGIQIKLQPREMAFYLLFIEKKEGIFLNYLIDYKKILKSYYFQLTGKDDGSTIDNIFNIHDNVASQIISRINRNLKKNLGESLASFYAIDKIENEPHRIRIDRELVSSSFNNGILNVL